MRKQSARNPRVSLLYSQSKYSRNRPAMKPGSTRAVCLLVTVKLHNFSQSTFRFWRRGRVRCDGRRRGRHQFGAHYAHGLRHTLDTWESETLKSARFSRSFPPPLSSHPPPSPLLHFSSWSSRLLVSISHCACRYSGSKQCPDVSLAAFGRKEIEIAEVNSNRIASLGKNAEYRLSLSA